MVAEPTVFIVDDDRAVRQALRLLVETVGLTVETYSSFPEFLDAYDRDRPGCLVLDVRMPGVSGIEGLEKLKAKGITIPVIIITAYGDVRTAVRAMKAGAVDFVEKPYNPQELLDRVQQCVDEDEKNRREDAVRAQIDARAQSLTPREQQVMRLLVDGKSNNSIASELGISRKTVEGHRAKVMEKMRADSIAELVKMVFKSAIV